MKGDKKMKVQDMIDALSKMPKDADLIVFTENCEEVTGVRLLEPDSDAVDLVEILYN